VELDKAEEVAAKSKDTKDDGGEDADKKKLKRGFEGDCCEKQNGSWEDVGIGDTGESQEVALHLPGADKMKQ
jgi:hypothetical protein